jgi:1,4-alpha-glucan branching enzyme
MLNTRIPVEGSLNRYSAKNNLKPINFYCDARGASQVSIVGDFNQWQPESDPLIKQPDGSWSVQLQLSHGHHQYMFLVDGEMKLDQRAQGIARNEKNERVSLISVS